MWLVVAWVHAKRTLTDIKTPILLLVSVYQQTCYFHRGREETGAVCFLDPVLIQLFTFFINYSFICFVHKFWTSNQILTISGLRKRGLSCLQTCHFYFKTSNTQNVDQPFLPSHRSIMCHLLISSCLWILPLLLSRKDTCVSLYWVITSTNFLDSTVCWGQMGAQG